MEVDTVVKCYFGSSAKMEILRRRFAYDANR
jgi:hypothetical protein